MGSGAAAFLNREPAPALVLSAGGMFGAWQAGAWTVLSRVFRPSAVIGASAGALNGWFIAGGMDPGELAERWLKTGMAGVMRPRFPWLPWNGIFAPQALEETVREMFAACRPRVPFAAALTEAPRLRRVLVRGEEMTWRHLMASCAVPFGFPPVRIDGKLYVDGGLLDVLPLWACPEMGAPCALALNALPYMPSMAVRWFARSARAVARHGPGRGPSELLRLAPDRPLGSAREALRWDEARVRAWIGQGARDAEKLLAARLSDSSAVFD